MGLVNFMSTMLYAVFVRLRALRSKALCVTASGVGKCVAPGSDQALELFVL